MKAIARHQWVGPAAAALVFAVLGCDNATGRAAPNPSIGNAVERNAPARTAPAPAPAHTPAPMQSEPEGETRTAAQKEDDPQAPVEPCSGAPFHYPAVAEACNRDGRRATKNLMRSTVAKAKRAGIELKCAQCHVDQKAFGLRPNAVDDLKAWL